MKHTAAFELSWQLATWEAAHSEFLQPDHLFLGALKLLSHYQKSQLNHEELPPEIVEALAEELDPLLDRLTSLDLDLDRLRRHLRALRGDDGYRRAPWEKEVHRSEASLRVFRAAASHGTRVEDPEVTCQGLLTALLDEQTVEPGAQRFAALAGAELTPDAFRAAIKKANRDPGANKPAPDGEQRPRSNEAGEAQHSPPEEPPSRANGVASPQATTLLERFGEDLTQRAREDRLESCIGRRAEMLRIVQTLARERNNSPLLIGERGIGRKTIVQGLAWRIARGNAPEVIQNTRILRCDLNTLQTSHRYGDHLSAFFREVAALPDLVLFIDEFHCLAKASEIDPTLGEAFTVLVSLLSRGALRLVGTTTPEGYQRYIEQNTALARCLQRVNVDEPSDEEVLEILRDRFKPRLEARYQVPIADDALRAAIDLTARYLPGQHLPANAIEVLDAACANFTVSWPSKIPGTEDAEAHETAVTAQSIAREVGDRAGIPVAQPGPAEAARLAGMADALKARVIGQDHACERVARSVQRARLGLKPAQQPIGALLFVGPTGVGKTELAKATAEFLFENEAAVVCIDMSEYQEAHSVARLIGAPPGYVGHDEPGQLTGALQRTPHCVVLLDEMEKAHAAIRDLFLQLFDEGRLTDAQGVTVDASHALFILTSNLPLGEPRPIGLSAHQDNETQLALIAQGLRPELVNRFDEVVVFRQLTSADLVRIAECLLSETAARLRAQDLELAWDDDVLNTLAQATVKTKFGARDLQRRLAREVEAVIANGLLSETFKPGQTLALTTRGDALAIEAAIPRTPSRQPTPPAAKPGAVEAPVIKLQVSCEPRFNYSLAEADVAFLHALTVTNQGSDPLEGQELRLTLPGYAESGVPLPTLLPGATERLAPLPALVLDRQRLAELPDPSKIPLQASLGGQPVHIDPPVEIEVLPPNALHLVGHEVALAGFVIPEAAGVQNLIKLAHTNLARLSGPGGFAETSKLEHVMKALYLCIQQNWELTYENEPRSYADDWQKVRFPDVVLHEQRQGTCIDLTLLYAACLEAVHRDPLIVLVKSESTEDDQSLHAVIGCWRVGAPVDGDAVIRDQEQLLRWVEADKIVLIDTVDFAHTESNPNGVDFDTCRRDCETLVMTQALVFALDVANARRAGVMALPFGRGTQFTHQAQRARYLARQEAERLGSGALGARHLLLGLLNLKDGLMPRILDACEDDLADRVRQRACDELAYHRARGTILKHTDAWKDMERAAKAHAEKPPKGGTATLVREQDLVHAILTTASKAQTLLTSEGADLAKCHAKLKELTARRQHLSSCHGEVVATKTPP